MTEKASVATFLIAAFQSEGQTAFLAGLSSVIVNFQRFSTPYPEVA